MFPQAMFPTHKAFHDALFQPGGRLAPAALEPSIPSQCHAAPPYPESWLHTTKVQVQKKPSAECYSPSSLESL